MGTAEREKEKKRLFLIPAKIEAGVMEFWRETMFECNSDLGVMGGVFKVLFETRMRKQQLFAWESESA